MKVLCLIPSPMEVNLLEDLLSCAPGTLACCGVGPVDAALGALEHLRKDPPQACLLADIGGTRDEARLPVGSLLWGTAVRNEAVGAGGGEDFIDLEGMALEGVEAPGEISLMALHDVGLSEEVAPLQGVIGTVAAASASYEEAETRQRLRPEVLVEEMEGWAVARACQRAGVPLGILRAVSNVAGDRRHETWAVKEALATLASVLAPLFSPSGEVEA
ncbi:MAG: hypothetical protein VX916_05300 [Planctomycetota bacterium]|nr:hypothetical protein [Planctomycetota bacterium]